jgi:hypothetical protein
MYLIFKGWYDSLTSMGEPDSGYDVVGYVETEEEAKEIVSAGGNHPRYYNEKPLYKYEEINKFEN